MRTFNYLAARNALLEVENEDLRARIDTRKASRKHRQALPLQASKSYTSTSMFWSPTRWTKSSINCVSIVASKLRRLLQSFARSTSRPRRKHKMSGRRSRSVSAERARRPRRPRGRLLNRLRNNKINSSATHSNLSNYPNKASARPHRRLLQSRQPKTACAWCYSRCN